MDDDEIPADAQDAAFAAVKVAAAEIRRLAQKQRDNAANGIGLSGFDGMDLERYQGVCLAYDDHRLKWMAKLDPGKLNDELIRRATRELEGEDGTATRRRARRPSAD